MRIAICFLLAVGLLGPACAPIDVSSGPRVEPAAAVIAEASPGTDLEPGKIPPVAPTVAATTDERVITATTPRSDIVWSNGNWSWAPASLAWNCWTNALACTNGAQGNFMNLFTAFSPTNERNTNFWFRHFKGWPAISVWNNGDTNLWPSNTTHTSGIGVTYQSAGVLVTPEHILTAGHMGFGRNTWLAFLDMTNNLVFRQVKDWVAIYSSPPITNYAATNMPWRPWSEYFIGLLDEPVPESIGFVRVVPTNWLAWFDAPFLNTSPGQPRHPVPLQMRYCQHRAPELQDLTYLQCDATNRYVYFNVKTLTNWAGHDFEVGGDSGSPWFFVLDGELCLARILSSNLSFAGGGGLFDPAYQHACINGAMRELSLRNGRKQVYSLTVKDLGRFPTYGRSFDCPP